MQPNTYSKVVGRYKPVTPEVKPNEQLDRENWLFADNTIRVITALEKLHSQAVTHAMTLSLQSSDKEASIRLIEASVLARTINLIREDKYEHQVV